MGGATEGIIIRTIYAPFLSQLHGRSSRLRTPTRRKWQVPLRRRNPVMFSFYYSLAGRELGQLSGNIIRGTLRAVEFGFPTLGIMILLHETSLGSTNTRGRRQNLRSLQLPVQRALPAGNWARRRAALSTESLAPIEFVVPLARRDDIWCRCPLFSSFRPIVCGIRPYNKLLSRIKLLDSRHTPKCLQRLTELYLSGRWLEVARSPQRNV